MTAVAVVIPHYDQQQQLDLVLAALELQTWPSAQLEVVVSHDGSPRPPRLGRRPYRTRLVQQRDLGFRAAAARNLGAAASDGDLLCFLDGDTVPEPGYVQAMVTAAAGRDVLVVGRRRHADLAGLSRLQLQQFLLRTDGHPMPREYPEPQWLVDAFCRTENLARADDASYRFIISAVMAMPRSLFDAVGGFEPAFTSYGGEDWELANRCWLTGADFVHAPDAVAWHDGPDFAGRGHDEAAVKNAEGLSVARFITDPAARGHGLWWSQPDVVVTLDDTGWSDAEVLLTVASLLRDTDVGLWLPGASPRRDLEPLDRDPRVRFGPPPADVLRRCRYRAEVAQPVVLDDTTLRQVCAVAPVHLLEGLTVRRTRDLSRGDLAAPASHEFAARRPQGSHLQQLWGRAARQSAAGRN